MIISISGNMAHFSSYMFVFIALFSLGYGHPLERAAPPSSSLVCSSVYHGQCINTYEYQCMGIAIPGVCGNTTSEHFNSISFGALTAIQCCNGWNIPKVGNGDGSDNGYSLGK